MISEEQIRDTTERYDQRKHDIDLRRGDWSEERNEHPFVDETERIRKRMQRIRLPVELVTGDASFMLRTASWQSPGAALDTLCYERILGRSDLISISFLEGGQRAARAVGRIVLRDTQGSLLGYGTGFLVSPSLLLTNHHVLESAEIAATSELQLEYEDEIGGHLRAGRPFSLAPDRLFITNRTLDYSLVALDSDAAGREYGHLKLIADEGKVIVGELVNIIQHPNGEPKQLAIRENQIVDVLPDFLHYRTDTAPGSSGAPVLNDQWEVVALHHSGVPERRNGRMLAVDGRPWEPQMGEHRIKWIANEGVRVSRLASDLQAAMRARSAAERALLSELFLSAPHDQTPAPPERGSRSTSAKPRIEQTDGTTRWTIPITVTVTVGEPGSADSAPAPTPVDAGGPRVNGFDRHAVDASWLASADALVGGIVEERTRAKDDYDGRKGYDETFLGEGFEVPLPGLGSWRRDAAPLLGQPGHELRYTNFSVIMSRSRRMPIVTAVNIHGRQLQLLPRKGDAWYFDPRIDAAYQIGNELYATNPLDRGHMVRRRDPVWGTQAVTANEDTFHYTNACPQHAHLNQRTWNDLENHILENAEARDLRVCVFTGPVLADEDPVYREVQLPRAYWKIAALVDSAHHALVASAYLLRQDRLIADLREFAFGRFRTYQVPIARLERLTGLDFSALEDADPLADLRGREALLHEIPIRSPRDIRLKPRSEP